MMLDEAEADQIKVDSPEYVTPAQEAHAENGAQAHSL